MEPTQADRERAESEILKELNDKHIKCEHEDEQICDLVLKLYDERAHVIALTRRVQELEGEIRRAKVRLLAEIKP